MPANGSVKHLECWYWKNVGHCEHSESGCLYAHHLTGQVAGKPVKREPGRPAVAGRNADACNPVYRDWRGDRSRVAHRNIQDQIAEIREKARIGLSNIQPLYQLPQVGIIFTTNNFGGHPPALTAPGSLQAGSSSTLSRPSYARPSESSHMPPIGPRLPTSSALVSSTAPNPQNSAHIWKPTAASGPSQLSAAVHLPTRPDSKSFSLPKNTSTLPISAPPQPKSPILPPVVEPWALQIRNLRASLSHSGVELSKGVRLFQISEEHTGPGAVLMLEELQKHFHTVIGLVNDMTKMLGEPVPDEEK